MDAHEEIMEIKMDAMDIDFWRRNFEAHMYDDDDNDGFDND